MYKRGQMLNNCRRACERSLGNCRRACERSLGNCRSARGIGKKGQEGMTLTTLLLIIVGIVVAVVIILGATGILGDFFGKRDVLPGQQLEAIAQSCKLSGEASLIADYCLEFKELDDDDFVNCNDPRVQAVIGDVQIDINCNDNQIGSQVDIKKREICAQASDRKRNETKVNSDTCQTLGFTVSSGQFATCAEIMQQDKNAEWGVVDTANTALDTTSKVSARCTALGGTDRTEDLDKNAGDYTSHVSSKQAGSRDVCCWWPGTVNFVP